MFDRRVLHDGYHNTYFFTKDGYKVVLKPMHPEEFAKKPKPERVKLMIRNGVIDHCGKGRPVLFAKAKAKPKEEGNKFVLEQLFVEDLDSRTSLFQPRETDVNARA